MMSLAKYLDVLPQQQQQQQKTKKQRRWYQPIRQILGEEKTSRNSTSGTRKMRSFSSGQDKKGDDEM